MTAALALHFPERRGIARWTLAAAAIIAGHSIVISALALWYTRAPRAQNIIPAIVVSFAPAAPISPVESEQPVTTQELERIDPTPEPPKVETRVEPAPEEVKPPPEEIKPPPRPAEIVLPKTEPKPVAKKPVEKKPVEKRLVETRPAQQASDKAAAHEAPRQSSVAASNAYASLVYGHLQRFKSYPASANGASGNVVARFVLNRSGSVLSASIVKSSGNAALDAEALATVHRANPFPPFPEEKPGSQDAVTAPMTFNR